MLKPQTMRMSPQNKILVTIVALLSLPALIIALEPPEPSAQMRGESGSGRAGDLPGAASDAISATAAEAPLTPEQAKGRDLCETACYYLDHESYSDVSGVPDMLRRAWTEHDYAPAAVKLLDVYEGKHKGLNADPKAAFELAKSIAENDELAARDAVHRDLQCLALFRLARYCERGFVGKKQPREAYLCMKKAADLGAARARVELALYQMRGTGCDPAPQEALRNLLLVHGKAPDTPNLYYYLGFMYAQGLGMKSAQPAEAVRFYRLGAKYNDPNAINNLGALYERGTPQTRRNYKLALKLYRKSASLGNREASANLQRLEFRTRLKGGTHETSFAQRLNHSLQRFVHALPLDESGKDKIIRRLRDFDNSHLNPAP